MRSGFLITPQGDTALELFEHDPAIRYAAELDDGRGFAAYDVDTLAEVYGLGMNGTIYAEIPAEEQERWDELERRLGRPQGPKRQSATGDERFILYRAPLSMTARLVPSWLEDNWHPRGVTVVATTPYELYILVEDGPDWLNDLIPLAMVWDCSVVAWRDIRVEAAV